MRRMVRLAMLGVAFMVLTGAQECRLVACETGSPQAIQKKREKGKPPFCQFSTGQVSFDQVENFA